MTAAKAAARSNATDQRVNEITQMLERSLVLIDGSGLPADIGARLDEVIKYLAEWQEPSST